MILIIRDLNTDATDVIECGSVDTDKVIERWQRNQQRLMVRPRRIPIMHKVAESDNMVDAIIESARLLRS